MESNLCRRRRNLAGGIARVWLCLLAALAATPARGETDQIRFGFGYGFSYLPIMVAQSEGLWEKKAREFGVGDLKVALHRFSGSPAMNEALISNQLDVAAYGAPGLIIAWDKTRGKLGIKGICGLSLSAYVLNVNKPTIKTLADFGNDDKIAVPAPTSPQAIVVRMAAEKFFGAGQHNRLDKLFVSLPHPDATTALLAGSGAIAGYVSSSPFSQILAKDPRIHAVMTSKDVFGGRDATGAAIGGVQRFVETNPTVMRAFLAALDEAVRFIDRNPRAAAEIYLRNEKSTLGLDETEQLVRDGSTVYSIAPSGMLTYAKFMAKIGMISSAPESWRDMFFPLTHDLPGS